ncbi:ArgE/DapE family deacylase [Virgibacillus halodenitrificans]|uniref:ArgE/DapE family deacylase n=1 Tax=Virgibacillus halodenitrificans TaxID=1482 RepID=A0ABR7VHV8_VIRHA|nr:ArgE/DapE family deacylase [Virgibacillus halodenitrificans]MBD1221276.1 ArgE/DapE family deacylase [Virgibacillus halodenitrificans]
MSEVENIKNVHKIIDDLWEEELLFLKTLGSYKSVLGKEKGIQTFIENHLNDMDLITTFFDPDPKKLASYKNFGKPEWSYENRPVLVGEWKSRSEKVGKSLILQGHIDVVSAEPEYLWNQDPFQPTIVNDKMYGRGICDMKSGVAAMIYAVKALKKAGIELGADLQIQSVIEEECTGNGALALLDAGFTADGALITEPTELRAIKGQLGVLWVKVKLNGSGAHVERAEKAQNAINKAALLIQSLEEYREHINSKPKHYDYAHHPHPLNVNVGVIQGGDWASNVPSECTFEARVGFYPDQDPADVQAEVKKWILDAAESDSWLKETPPEVSFYGFSAPGFSSSSDQELFKTLASAHKVTTGKEMESIAFTATTDIRAFEEFGIPATCYGAAGANMHAPNEYIDLNSLKTATKSIAAFILDWCKEAQ